MPRKLFLKLYHFLFKYRWYFAVFVLSLPAIKDLLLPGYFPMHDDLQILRLDGLHQCFVDLQIPCRWIPDAGFGLGYPMFNYYPPLPYYIAEGFHLLGFDLFWSIKIISILAFVLPGFFMFALAKEFVAPFYAIVAAVFYIYAPYHSVDIYVRGALNEAWGLVWFPLTFLHAYRIITKPSKSATLGFSVSYASLLLSHNVMTLIFTPLLGLWSLSWIIVTKNFKAIKDLVLAGILSIGLAAFFFIPVVAEKSLAHVESMTVGYFNYLAHYADINQMFFSRFWSYGGSTWGPNDDMAFPIGHLHWGLTLVVCFFFTGNLILSILRKKFHKLLALSLIGLLLTFATFFYIFLIHSRSIWFWDNLPLLYYAQFPWRLLAIPTFIFSFLVTFLFVFLPKNRILRGVTAGVLIVAVIAWNLPFFRIQRQVFTTIQEKTSGHAWEIQTTGGIFDYLPKTASRPPGAPGQIYPEFIKGQGSILEFHKNTNTISFDARITSQEAVLQFPIFDYPNWVVKVDGKKIEHTHDADLGRIEISVNKGDHKVKARLHNTPIRTISNLITLFSLLYLFRQLKTTLTKNGYNKS